MHVNQMFAKTDCKQKRRQGNKIHTGSLFASSLLLSYVTLAAYNGKSNFMHVNFFHVHSASCSAPTVCYISVLSPPRERLCWLLLYCCRLIFALPRPPPSALACADLRRGTCLCSRTTGSMHLHILRCFMAKFFRARARFRRTGKMRMGWLWR